MKDEEKIKEKEKKNEPKSKMHPGTFHGRGLYISWRDAFTTCDFEKASWHDAFKKAIAR